MIATGSAHVIQRDLGTLMVVAEEYISLGVSLYSYPRPVFGYAIV